jgi:hypothetical protein
VASKPSPFSAIHLFRRGSQQEKIEVPQSPIAIGLVDKFEGVSKSSQIRIVDANIRSSAVFSTASHIHPDVGYNLRIKSLVGSQ